MSDTIGLPDKVVRRITEDVVEQVGEWFYQQNLGIDPDALYEEIADRQSLDLEIETALKLIKVVVPSRDDEAQPATG